MKCSKASQEPQYFLSSRAAGSLNHSGLKVCHSGFRNLGFRIYSLRCRIQGLGYMLSCDKDLQNLMVYLGQKRDYMELYRDDMSYSLSS